MVARSLFRGGLRLLSRCFRVSKFHHSSQEVFMRAILNDVLYAVDVQATRILKLQSFQIGSFYTSIECACFVAYACAFLILRLQSFQIGSFYTSIECACFAYVLAMSGRSQMIEGSAAYNLPHKKTHYDTSIAIINRFMMIMTCL